MNERGLGEKMAAVEGYKANLGVLAQQEEYIKQALDNFMVARETLRSYSSAKEGEEILVPVGGSAYLLARIGDNRRVLRGIGNDIVIEEDFPHAVDSLTAQIEEMGRALQEISARIVDMERKLQRLSAEVQQEYSAMDAGAEAQG